ncbi:T9SS type A sorting domain-containing protein [uncultured Tenacibaculum sp.]|uniref:T9SS type A sorting domain-containing protein n=1 Tax=uncultured Tenacibaculum sp. TaxID=174713 RepID=UPI0026088E35|nr:T9SS type A sorting domain-containing protein [uncultured Tenacibaculum sp.]
MKKKLPLIILLFINTIMLGQDLSFTFVNAQNTNDGTYDYYEADVYISSTVDFKLGKGQIYFNYNTTAFGNNVKANNRVEITALNTEGYICGQGVDAASSAKIYSDFIVIDNISSRVSVSFVQTFSSSTFATNNVTSIPTKLFHIKIKYVNINENPMVSFETGISQSTNLFYTACGSASSGPFDGANCVDYEGTQLLGATFNSIGASRIDEIVWDGDTSISWLNNSNWDSGTVPTITNDIIIPNVVNTPEVNSSVQINDLTVESLSSFDISENGSVTIEGNLVNNGVFTMLSTASNSSSLLVKGTTNGEVVYKRGGLLANAWSIISAPVHGQSIKEFAENSENAIRINTSTTPNRYAISYYDDSKVTGSKWVYYDVDYLAANPSETFEKGKSYAISRAANGTVIFKGTIEKSDVTKSVTVSEWNAVGNPYTAFLPINENGGTNFINSNLSKFDPVNVGVYVWDNAQSKYVGKSLASSEASLAPGQGFFVKTTTGVTDIIFNQSQRKIQPTTGGIFARGEKTIRPSIQLLVTSKSTTIDTNIKYLKNATLGLDPGYDLGNYSRSNFDVYTRLLNNEEGDDFTIQCLPIESIETTILPIGLKISSEEEVSFTIKTQGLPQGLEVFIEDRELKTFTKLDTSKNDIYTIVIKEKLNGVGRFYLHTQQSKIETVNTNIDDVKIYTESKNTLIVNGISDEEFEVNLYTVNGVLLLNESVKGLGNNSIALPSLQIGVYVVEVNSELGKKTQKIIIK